jgi:hypothetical protein
MTEREDSENVCSKTKNLPNGPFQGTASVLAVNDIAAAAQTRQKAVKTKRKHNL